MHEGVVGRRKSQWTTDFSQNSRIYIVYNSHVTGSNSSIGQHLYCPFPWLSRFKLRFDTTPCGHELAFGTKSYYVVYYAYTYIRVNIIKHKWRTSMNERIHFFIKICISHALLSMFLWCVRDEWRQGKTAILTQLPLLTIAALLLHLGLSCWTGSRWGPQPTVYKMALTLGFLSPTNSTAAGTCLYSFITPLASAFSSAYLHRCISDWLLGQGSIYNKSLNIKFWAPPVPG